MPSKTNKTTPVATTQQEVDNLQMMRSSPILYLRTVLVQFLQGLFWYLPRGHYHWEANVDESEIVITDESPLKVKEYGGRPGITITRSAITFSSLGLDDMAEYDMQTQTKTKSVLVPGNMTINCCSRESLESEALAFWVAEHLWLLRDLLQRKSIYQIGQNIGVGAPSAAGSLVAADQGDEWTVTSAVVPFQLVRTGQVTPLGQRIARDVELSLQQRNGSFVSSGASSGSSADEGVAAVFQPSTTNKGNVGKFGQPGVEVEQVLNPPRIRGRPIPLAGSGMGES